MIKRDLQARLDLSFSNKKTTIIYGPRQVGKTTLMKNFFDSYQGIKQWLDCDFQSNKELLTNVSLERMKVLLGDTKLLCIDEAQRVENIGLTLKILADNFKEIQVIATGSSAFEIANKVNEPLTGRKIELHLYPFSAKELFTHFGGLTERNNLETRLIYGSYPDIVTHPAHALENLVELTNSYLYKDIFEHEEIRSSGLLNKLLKALAYQVGSQVSFNELANITGSSPKTIEKYVSLLEQTFVVFRVGTFSRNLRNELTKSTKIYFYDNGVRNALISNFNPIISRNDKGALWENYIFSERKKYLSYNKIKNEMYFWRTKQQQEIDLVEINGDSIKAFEFKFSENTKVKLSKTFSNAYPNQSFEVISPENYFSFLGIE